MDPSPVVIPDHVPAVWPQPAGATCACSVPLPEVRATRKGAARTHCARCGRPIRLDFGRGPAPAAAEPPPPLSARLRQAYGE